MIKNPYLKKRPNPTLENRLPSLTKQAHKDSCNLINILKRFSVAGLPILENSGFPTSQCEDPQNVIDTTKIPPYDVMLNIVANAEQQYQQLPKDIKKRFNTLEQYSNFLSDPNNKQEAISLGLIPNSNLDDGLQSIKQEPASSTNEAKQEQSTNNE